MLTKKVPAYFVLLGFLFSFIICFGFKVLDKSNSKEPEETTKIDTNSKLSCNLNIARLKGYRFIHPLLYAEPNCEAPELMSYKGQIEQIINSNKQNGNITSASVYIREFSQAEWVVINEDEKYSPGSLLKVPELIAYYKMEELNPGYLDKKITYDKKNTSDKIISFNDNHIELGKSYTIRELLKYMIVYSDNEATMILNKLIDGNIFKRVFSDIGLREPDFKSPVYLMDVMDYSIFMKELYNSSYLNFKHSEECLELMSQAKFSEGLISGLPGGCDVVHKFGESGTTDNPNFSESAIVYCGKKPYLLTVMTKGKDMKKLPKVISEISKKVYEVMSGRV